MGTWSFRKCYNKAPGSDWASLPREDIKIQPRLWTTRLDWFIHNNHLCKGVDHNASLLLLSLKYQSNPLSNSRADKSGYQKGKLFYVGHLVSLTPSSKEQLRVEHWTLVPVDTQLFCESHCPSLTTPKGESGKWPHFAGEETETLQVLITNSLNTKQL